MPEKKRLPLEKSPPRKTTCNVIAAFAPLFAGGSAKAKSASSQTKGFGDAMARKETELSARRGCTSLSMKPNFVGLFEMVRESKTAGRATLASALACPSAASQPSARARSLST